MQLTINNKAVDVAEETEITVQLNNPLSVFKLQGDKTFSFSLPNTPKNRSLLLNTQHLQASLLPTNLEANVKVGGVSIIQGKTRLRKASEKGFTIDTLVPPGNVTKDFWQKKLRDIDLGKDVLPTQKVSTSIYATLFTDTATQTNTVSTPPTIKTIQFSEMIWLRFVQFRIKIGTQEVFKHEFTTENTTPDDMEGELIAAFATFNSNTANVGKELHLAGKSINFIIINPAQEPVIELLGAWVSSSVIATFPMKRLVYDSVNEELTASKLVAKPYAFVQVLAEKFYNEKNPDYNGYINAKNVNALIGGFANELLLNTEANKVAYPLVPSFTFKWIFEQLFSVIGYENTFIWGEWADLYFCGFYDMALQCPGTEFPFNVYPSIIDYRLYMPDWTVQEFFDEFALLTGSVWDWDVNLKKVNLVPFTTIIAQTVKMPTPVALSEINFDDIIYYQLGYSGNYDTEIATDTVNKDALTAFFADYPPTDTIERTKITMKLVPMCPKTTVDTYNTANSLENTYVLCHNVGGSILPVPLDTSVIFSPFDLRGETPSPRIFFYAYSTDLTNLELNRYAKTVSTSGKIELSMAEEKGLVSLWKTILTQRKSKKINIKTLMSITDFRKLKFTALLQIRNINYIINQLTIKLKKNQAVFSVEMELEQVS